MADSLGVAGYDAQFAFSWSSSSSDPQAIIDAGHALTAQVIQTYQSFGALEPNDVVDVHLIGHSRGSVVISLAMQELVATSIPQIQHGYMKMTLLDPHPANNYYGDNASYPDDSLLLDAYRLFQEAVADPPVVVPGRINEVEHFWQHNHWYDDLPDFLESTQLNLWGLDPGYIQYRDPIFTRGFAYPLTGILGIGHTEVHDYYQGNFIPSGPAAPATSRGGNPRTAAPLIFEPALFEPTQTVAASSLLRQTSSAGSGPPETNPVPALPLPPDRGRVDRYFTVLSRAVRDRGLARTDSIGLHSPGLEIYIANDGWLRAVVPAVPSV